MYSEIAVQDGVKLGPWSPSSCTEYGGGDGRNGGDYQRCARLAPLRGRGKLRQVHHAGQGHHAGQSHHVGQGHHAGEVITLVKGISLLSPDAPEGQLLVKDERRRGWRSSRPSPSVAAFPPKL